MKLRFEIVDREHPEWRGHRSSTLERARGQYKHAYPQERFWIKDRLTGEDVTTGYVAQSARDAERTNYGDKSYWDYLDESAQESYDYFIRHGDKVTAKTMFTRTLSESLMGNDGD